jgi:hypothetical protein
MNIYEINVSNEYRQIVEYIKNGLKDIFSRSHAVEGDVYVVNYFPAATDGFGETELLIFISIPDKKGNYYWHFEKNKRYYLNSLVIGIKMLYDDSITDVDATTLYSSEGYLDYIEELGNEEFCLQKFSSCCNNSLRNCAYFYWIVTSGCKKSYTNDYILFNTPLDISKVLYSACHRTLFKQGINCFGKVDDLGEMVRNYIDEANNRTEIGILTKNRIDKITEKGVKTPLRVLANQGKAITILRGKAGSGKTLMLTRVFNSVIVSGHHCRFLTFNHLLVFDLKHCLCRIPAYRNTNAYIHTLHYFFYHFSKKMGIHSLFTEERLNELMDVCVQRIDIANKYIQIFKEETNKWPNNEQFWEKYKDVIDSGDSAEITKYLKYLDINIYSLESLGKLREAYIQKRRDLLLNELGNELFLADYNKVLENTYLMLDKPREFYEKYNIKDRRELLNLMSKTDKTKDDDFASDYHYEEFSKDVQNTIMHTKWWSKSVLIDEAQDCNNYEKLILMKVYGAENIVITSGGKDQLIRTSLVTDWTHALEKPIPADFPPLTGRCYRQKENIVRFVNSFGEYFKTASPIKSANESHGLGRVIIDARSSVRGFSNETLSKIREEGKVLGCSDYEYCLVLLPTTGYTSRTIERGIHIDELDNVDIIDKSTNRKLEISSQELKIWNGVVEWKGKLSVPAANQTRFIYYESCRGLEAWNVLCVDLDTFFYNMRCSKDAELYARTNQEFFSYQEDLKSEFALHWVYMAITRPIDTLYIKLNNPSNEFSQRIVEIGKACGAEILSDPVDENLINDELPF